MRQSTERVLTTHVGSLCRPADITEVLRAKTVGDPYDEAAFTERLGPAVEDVVARQAEAGVDIPSDGEFGKSMWTGYVAERLGGVEAVPLTGPLSASPRLQSKDRQDFADFYDVYNREAGSLWIPAAVRARHPGDSWMSPTRLTCTGPVTYIGERAIARDIANLTAAMSQNGVEEAFLPLAAPASVEATVPNAFYEDDESYLGALADALRVEYRAVVDAGLILQVDDAFIAYNYDRFLLDAMTMAEYRRHCEVRVEVLNEALRGIPEDRVRYHVCWGSWAGPHSSDVPLADIIDIVLSVHAQAYSIEAANPRHEYEWEVFEQTRLPVDKILIPGVVTHSTNVVEHPRTVAQRIERYARLVGRENVIAGTDCGFSQGWSMPRTHESVQWAKLRALAQGAALASEHLVRA